MTGEDVQGDAAWMPLLDLRDSLLRAAREDCWCSTRPKPCEVHDAYDDGLLAVVERLQAVGFHHPEFGFSSLKHGITGDENSGRFAYVLTVDIGRTRGES